MNRPTGAVQKFATDLADHFDLEALLVAEVAGVPAGTSLILPDLNKLLMKLRAVPR